MFNGRSVVSLGVVITAVVGTHWLLAPGTCIMPGRSVWAGKSGLSYHRRFCPYSTPSATEQPLTYALRDGKTPCPECHPGGTTISEYDALLVKAHAQPDLAVALSTMLLGLITGAYVLLTAFSVGELRRQRLDGAIPILSAAWQMRQLESSRQYDLALINDGPGTALQINARMTYRSPARHKDDAYSDDMTFKIMSIGPGASYHTAVSRNHVGDAPLTIVAEYEDIHRRRFLTSQVLVVDETISTEFRQESLLEGYRRRLRALRS